tara:strand:- start:53 stop:220 length:168 start_codon:yes stop_codon:yes gene_type:complete
MFLLLGFVFFIQFITFWIFEPFTSFLTNVFEIRFLPLVALLVGVYLFSGKDKHAN